MNTDTNMNDWPVQDASPDNTYPTAGGPCQTEWPSNNSRNEDSSYPPQDLNPQNDYPTPGPAVTGWA